MRNLYFGFFDSIYGRGHVFGMRSQNIVADSSYLSIHTPQREIAKEQTYESVDNYCGSSYDWSVAKDNSNIIYVE